MKSGENKKIKKPYRSPKLVKYGNLISLTRGSSGTRRDGSVAQKTKASGSA